MLLDMKNSIFQTSFILHITIYEKFPIMFCTTLACTIQMMIFNITAIVETNHTIKSGVNFKTRNLKHANKTYLNLD